MPSDSSNGGERLYLRGRTWWCWGYDLNGKRWQESTHQRDRRAAATALKRIERNRAIPTNRAAKALTLEQALDLLQQALRRDGKSPNTQRFYRDNSRHLVRVLGAKTLVADLSLVDCHRHMEHRLEEEADRHTIQKEFRTLQYALRTCKAVDLYLGNPSEFMPAAFKKKSSYYTPRETWLENGEQVQRLIDATSTGPQTRTCRKMHIAAYVHTGLRKDELYAIHPEHVNLGARTAWVNATKTDGSRRIVHLNDTALAVFRAKLEAATGDGPIFEHWASADRDLRAACARAELPEMSFNDLRRTFCSLMANAGVPAQHCAKLMGHASLDMVMQVYARLAPESLLGAVQKLPQTRLVAVTEAVTATPPKRPSGGAK